MTLGKIVFWFHLITGLTISIIILLMSVTGVILTYDQQVTNWAHRNYRSQPHRLNSPPLQMDELIQAVTTTLETPPTAITILNDPQEPAALNVGRGDYRYANRYTGALLNDSDAPMRHFLRSIMYWHRWLALEGANREIGRNITGVGNLGFLILLISGLYLLCIRFKKINSLRTLITFRPELKGKARDLNWHNVVGFWLFLPLLIIVLSGVVISYQWAGTLMYRLVGEQPPTATSLRASTGNELLTAESEPSPIAQCSYQTLFNRASGEVPDWKSITLELRESNHTPAVVRVDRSLGGQPSRRLDLIFAGPDCTEHEVGGYPVHSRGQRLRSWLRYAHTGEVYGIVGQTIAGLASLGGGVLVWTALALSWRRFIKP